MNTRSTRTGHCDVWIRKEEKAKARAAEEAKEKLQAEVERLKKLLEAKK
mgnify:CR=1 FL=1